MATTMQRESTEYLYHGVTGDVPANGAEVAFLVAGVRPEAEDWHGAEVVTAEHPLWDDAVRAGLTGDYFVAILVGPFGNAVTLSPGDYQVWLRLTDVVEQPVRIAPVVLTIT